MCSFDDDEGPGIQGTGSCLTRKSLLNINHLPRTRLHKPAPPLPRPLQPYPTTDHSRILQIALIPRHNFNRRSDAPARPRGVLQPLLRFDIDHLHEVFQRVEGRGVRDVVHEEEGVGFEVAGCPEAAVFFLPGGVGEGEEVREAVYGAGYGVGVFNCGVVSGWRVSE
jgi:hypothetical protein